jgi:hypothetical protein
MSDPAADRNPFRCFTSEYLVGALLVGAAIILLARFGRGFDPGSAPRLAIASVQALLIAGLAVVSVLSIRRLDELMLKLHLEAIAVSFTLTGALIAGWGMLEKGGAPRIDWGLWAWPGMTVLWGIAVIIRSRQFR